MLTFLGTIFWQQPRKGPPQPLAPSLTDFVGKGLRHRTGDPVEKPQRHEDWGIQKPFN
jgi:hypothetical protein